MEQRKRSRKVVYFSVILVFLLVLLGVFFGIQFITKTGVFRVPGVVYYDESLTTSERALLETVFSEQDDLDKDVYISARTETSLPKLGENEFLSAVSVAVADFNETRTDISEYSADEYKIIDIGELDFSKKLLEINDAYYLDTFNSGAYFRIIKFESEKYTEEIEPLVSGLYTATFPTDDTVLTMAQTGVTALSRGMKTKLDKVGDATYFSEKISTFLSDFDLTHTSNESSFTDYATSDNICSDWRFVDTLTDIGLDIVELTGNHNQDCGDTAAEETIDTYLKNGIKIVGGGKTATAAAQALEINEKSNQITMFAYNLSTGGATEDNTPGANQYYEETASAEIMEAKARGDFVIVDVQYYECAAYASEYEDPTCDYADSAAGDQVGFFRHLVELGADVVVGTSAHQPQTFELYEGGAIYYGLGNLFFDQVWWPGTTRSLVLAHYFYQGKLLQTKIVPTEYDDGMQTALMDEDSAREFLNRLISAQP